MKISEVIQKLTVLKTELGDVPVVTIGDIEAEEVKIREVEEITPMNIRSTNNPKMAVFLDA